MDAEPLDEPHAAHVGSEIIDFHRTFADVAAVILMADVQAEVLDTGHVQIPFVKRFFVHRADVGEALLFEVTDQVARDESTRAGDDQQVIFLQRWILFHKSVRFRFHINFFYVQR